MHAYARAVTRAHIQRIYFPFHYATILMRYIVEDFEVFLMTDGRILNV